MENKKAKKWLLVIMGILIILEILIRVVIIEVTTLSAITQLISLVFTAAYVFWLYNKPHGNMLKYAMLLFAFAMITSSCYLLLMGAKYNNIVKILASAAVCYCAGRLNRIDQNKYIMPIIGIVFLGLSVYGAYYSLANNSDKVLLIPACFNYTINYITLIFAYFVRYDEHKEAGLMDAPKK